MKNKMGYKMKKSTKKKIIREIVIIIIAIIIIGINNYNERKSIQEGLDQKISFDLSSIPAYENSPYVIINENKPEFKEEDYTTKAFEKYSNLDKFGRCGVAYANICKEIMPKDGEKRGTISMVKPSGWQKTKYEGLVEGNYLYNRCHLIGYQLAGENANEKNLITGTRYMNVQGMLPFENQVNNYIEKHKKNHVLYRVTPIFEGNNLVANGVQMEAYSVEDKGKGVCFNIYVYNVQPGITIDYSTGKSQLIK